MPSLNVSVPKPLSDWIDQCVEDGNYEDESAYVRSLIQKDQANATDRGTLITALIEGESSGISHRTVPDIVTCLKPSVRVMHQAQETHRHL